MTEHKITNTTVYIAGPDGIGKTTYLKNIEEDLKSQGKKTKHVWIRSPKITSKPLMAYCRLTGLTKYKTIDKVSYGIHEFYKSKFVSWIFPKLQLIDFKIKWKSERKKILVDEIVLFDRFSLDTLADLMVDTHRMDLHKTSVGESFINMLPENIKLIILHVDEDVIRSRKKDTLYDETLATKIKVYQILSKDLGLKVIDNNRGFNDVKNDINIFLNE